MHAKVKLPSRSAQEPGRRPIVLYVDNQEQSRQAVRLLESAGVQLDIERDSPGDADIVPTAVYRGWLYSGLEKIEILKQQLDFELRTQEEIASR